MHEKIAKEIEYRPREVCILKVYKIWKSANCKIVCSGFLEGDYGRE